MTLSNCINCKRTIQLKDVVRIYERKEGKLTGKNFDLCPPCASKKIELELKDSNLSGYVKGKYVDDFDKSFLIKMWKKKMEYLK